MTDPGRSYRLLIVDDDETDRRLYSRLLTRFALGACEFDHAHDGASGLAMLRAQPFDCVLLDYCLPDMTGLEFLADAVAEDELPCAVIVVTGQGNELAAVQAMKRGAQDYLVKDQVGVGDVWRAITAAVTQTELRERRASSVREFPSGNAVREQDVATHQTEAELRTAKEAAEQASHAKTHLVAMVAHELRTPLNGILGYAELLRIEGGLSARQDMRVGAMMQAGRHLLKLIERVLDFATIETGRAELRPSVVGVRDLTEECMVFIGPLATERALSLRTVSAFDAPQHIVADPARLRQVLLNLLGNAVKYTPVGNVELRVLPGALQGGLRIEVADTGPGINEANRNRLFKEFERLDALTSMEGAGLGLAISVRIVGLMGGKIGHFANPGGGSVFWLELPPANIVPESLPAVGLPPAPRSLSPGMSILLVDDIAMNRDVIGGFLRAAGHEVLLADCGQEAVQLASHRVFDVILMDLRMPDVDGLEATRRIRAMPAPRRWTPILALTAHAFPEQVEQCREAGMDGHIAKPVEYATLIRAIGDVTAGVSVSWASHSPSTTCPGAEEPEHPPFDRAVFSQMAERLPAADIATNLQSLCDQKEEILRLLDERSAPALLGVAAHSLASAAGMFGFTALSAVARKFEQALTLNEPEVDQLARQVRDAAQAGLIAANALRHENLNPPARP